MQGTSKIGHVHGSLLNFFEVQSHDVSFMAQHGTIHDPGTKTGCDLVNLEVNLAAWVGAAIFRPRAQFCVFFPHQIGWIYRNWLFVSPPYASKYLLSLLRKCLG